MICSCCSTHLVYCEKFGCEMPLIYCHHHCYKKCGNYTKEICLSQLNSMEIVRQQNYNYFNGVSFIELVGGASRFENFRQRKDQSTWD